MLKKRKKNFPTLRSTGVYIDNLRLLVIQFSLIEKKKHERSPKVGLLSGTAFQPAILRTECRSCRTKPSNPIL